MNLNLNFKAGAVLACALVLSACDSSSTNSANGSMIIEPGVEARTGVYHLNNGTDVSKSVTYDTAGNIVSESTEEVTTLPEAAHYFEFSDDKSTLKFQLASLGNGPLSGRGTIEELYLQEDGTYLQITSEVDGENERTSEDRVFSLNSSGLFFASDVSYFTDGLLTETYHSEFKANELSFVEDNFNEYYENFINYSQPILLDNVISIPDFFSGPSLRASYFTNESLSPVELTFNLVNYENRHINKFSYGVFIDLYRSDTSPITDGSNYLEYTKNEEGSHSPNILTYSLVVEPKETIFIEFEAFEIYFDSMKDYTDQPALIEVSVN